MISSTATLSLIFSREFDSCTQEAVRGMRKDKGLSPIFLNTIAYKCIMCHNRGAEATMTFEFPHFKTSLARKVGKNVEV